MSEERPRARVRQNRVRTAGSTGTRLLVAFAVVIAAIAASLAHAQSAEAAARGVSVSWKWQGTRCVLVRGGDEAAEVHVQLSVNNGHGFSNYATNMRVQARLVPSGPGLDLASSWRTARFPSKDSTPDELLQDHAYAANFDVLTDGVAPGAEWKLQIKLIWDRTAPNSDHVQTYSHTFNDAACADNGVAALPDLLDGIS